MLFLKRGRHERRSGHVTSEQIEAIKEDVKRQIEEELSDRTFMGYLDDGTPYDIHLESVRLTSVDWSDLEIR